MGNNVKTNVPNIHEKYHPALFKDFIFIKENVKKNAISRTKSLLLMLTTLIWNSSQRFWNIKCQKGPKSWLPARFCVSQNVHNEDMRPFLKKNISVTAYDNTHGDIVISVFL